MLKLDVIENESELNPLLRDWERLSTATPMQSPTWMLAWWEAFRTSSSRLRVIVVRDEADSVLGLAPWYAHSQPALGTTIKFLGSDRACSDYQTILCQPGSEEAIVRTLSEWLSMGKHSPSGESSSWTSRAFAWDLLDFDGVAVTDTTMDLFIDQMAARGHVTHRREGENTWKLNICGNWEAFLDTQSRTQRGQCRNLVNRFDKSGDLELRLASDKPSTADSLITALVELHAMRWRAVGQDGCFGDARMKQFFVSAMRSMVADGSANVAVVQRNGHPVAAQGWLVQGKELFMYQCGRDPAEEAHRIGRIANLVGIRWATQHGFQSLDYLRGDETYKSQLRATPIPSQRVRIVARAGFPELRHNVWLACRELKSRWQQLRSADTKPVQRASQESSAADDGAH